jgi:hypothetical protein
VPFQVTVDKLRRVVTTRGWGHLSDADFALLHQHFNTDPDFDPMFARICDLSEVTTVAVSDQLLDSWAADPLTNSATVHAVVCTAPPVLKRVLDFAVRSRKYFRDVSIFPTYGDAATWVERRPGGDSSPQ